MVGWPLSTAYLTKMRCDAFKPSINSILKPNPMDDKLWKLAQAVYTGLPGIVRKEKCGRALSEQVVVMAIYNSLEKYEKEVMNGNTLPTQ